jgi:hypothetical protein
VLVGVARGHTGQASHSGPLGEPRAGQSTNWCATGLLPEYTYIERTSQPGAAPVAVEIRSENILQCPADVTNSAQILGDLPGACLQWALTSSNQKYDVLADPTPPLRTVVTQVGLGCT